MPTQLQRLAASPETGDDDPRVTTVMTSRLVAVTMDTSVSTALLLMAREGVRHLPVMQGQACVGLVLESDLVRCLAETGPLTAAAGLHVGEFARSTAPLPTSARRSEAARRMVTECSDAVLVAGHDQLLGIVTASDLVRSLAAVAAQAPAPEGRSR
jgi:predicted transcriptional regulator